MNVKSPAALLLAALTAVALLGCKPYAIEEASPPPAGIIAPAGEDGPPAPAAPDPRTVVDLRKKAEQSLLPAMKAPLVEFIRAQEWYVDVTPAEYTMLETLRDTDKAAERFGTAALFMDTLRLSTEQWWYTDGFDDNEAKAMTAMFRAYQQSLTDRGVPNIGKLMAFSLRGNYFYVVQLPESGEVTVVLAADEKYAKLAPGALHQVVENLPKVETIVGKFPYPFVHVYITDLPEGIAGMQRNEFVWLSPTDINVEVVSHELTHATLYGLFPTWFEEGFAYFVGFYSEGTLDAKEREAVQLFASVRVPRKLDLSLKFDHSSYGYISNILQGFLFFKGLADIQGLESMGQVIRSLRSKTYTNDNELLRAIVSNSPPDKQQQVQTYLCGAVLGLRSGC
jgi:hypothetical protein